MGRRVGDRRTHTAYAAGGRQRKPSASLSQLSAPSASRPASTAAAVRADGQPWIQKSASPPGSAMSRVSHEWGVKTNEHANATSTGASARAVRRVVVDVK